MGRDGFVIIDQHLQIIFNFSNCPNGHRIFKQGQNGILYENNEQMALYMH